MAGADARSVQTTGLHRIVTIDAIGSRRLAFRAAPDLHTHPLRYRVSPLAAFFCLLVF